MSDNDSAKPMSINEVTHRGVTGGLLALLASGFLALILFMNSQIAGRVERMESNQIRLFEQQAKMQEHLDRFERESNKRLEHIELLLVQVDGALRDLKKDKVQ
jgi:hypothetical protein